MSTLQPVTLKKAKILLVDDQTINLELLRDILTPAKYRLAEASSGAEALALVATFAPDLILLDVTMPSMDGFEVCQQVKKNPASRHIPILFVTARTESESLVRGFALGGSDYLSKPFNASEILARVAHHIESSTHRSYLKGMIHSLEEALVLAKEETNTALRARKLLLDNFSHEFNTPLHAILGFSDALLRQDKDGSCRAFLQGIQQGGKDLHRTCNNLLHISRIESGQVNVRWEVTDLGLLIERVLAQIAYLLERHNNRFYLDCKKPLGMIYTDPGKLEQILFSLLGNACKFAPGGELILTIRDSESSATPSVIFGIHDTGTGIASEDLEDIFHPFYQVDPSLTRRFGGTGLGLAITQHFCEALGGQLEVASDLGVGSTFVLVHPRGEQIQNYN